MSATETGDLGVADAVGGVFRAALGLGRGAARTFEFELREVTARFGRRIASLVVASIVAAVGVLAAMGALAVMAERFLGVPLWAGLGLLGLTAGGVGAFAMRNALKRLSDGDLAFPRTIEEFGKDVEALAQRRDR